MRTRSRGGLAVVTAAAGVFFAVPGIGVPVAGDRGKAERVGAAAAGAPATVDEARGRARLLHETIHGTLQVVHRDFFDPDNRDRIPSATLKDVFAVLAESHGVEVRWLGVQGKTMDVDHRPKDEFERKAVAALDSGEKEFEAVEGNRYRHAGTIHLHNRCLKCHVPQRTNLEDRVAGLVISMRFGAKQESGPSGSE